MKPRRTPTSNKVWSLPGGNEDNDLWAEEKEVSMDGTPFVHVTQIRSVWEFTPEEREAIAAGANLSFGLLGSVMPPVELYITDEPLGAGAPDGNQ